MHVKAAYSELFTMLACTKMPGTNAYHDRFQSTFSRIYNLLDHPSKDQYSSKYSRHNNVVVISSYPVTKWHDDNHSEEVPSEG